MFKGTPNMRMALYVVSILVNGAAIVVRPLAAEWGDALQYIGGALAAFTGVVALSNVERESTRSRTQRVVAEELAEAAPQLSVRCANVNAAGERCILPINHAETYGHEYAGV